jgi:hypothetical protein
MSISGGRDTRRYDEAEELMADLEALVSYGLITAVREVGGQTRYCLAPRDGDPSSSGDVGVAPGAVFAAG